MVTHSSAHPTTDALLSANALPSSPQTYDARNANVALEQVVTVAAVQVEPQPQAAIHEGGPSHAGRLFDPHAAPVDASQAMTNLATSSLSDTGSSFMSTRESVV